MPFGVSPEEMWMMALRFLKFIARVPVAALVIAFTAFASFVLFMALFRATQYTWTHWLASAWGQEVGGG